jgi:hypothetical protein
VGSKAHCLSSIKASRVKLGGHLYKEGLVSLEAMSRSSSPEDGPKRWKSFFPSPGAGDVAFESSSEYGFASKHATSRER